MIDLPTKDTRLEVQNILTHYRIIILCCMSINYYFPFLEHDRDHERRSRTARHDSDARESIQRTTFNSK